MRKVFSFCIIAGMFIILGTAGGSDLGYWDMTGIVARSCIGILLMAIGCIGHKFSEVRK